MVSFTPQRKRSWNPMDTRLSGPLNSHGKMKRKISRPCKEQNPDSLVMQPVTYQFYCTLPTLPSELSWIICKAEDKFHWFWSSYINFVFEAGAEQTDHWFKFTSDSFHIDIDWVQCGYIAICATKVALMKNYSSLKMHIVQYWVLVYLKMYTNILLLLLYIFCKLVI